jgi:peptidoglycan hydrolase-like protein with peptidoglycan-binding domain
MYPHGVVEPSGFAEAHPAASPRAGEVGRIKARRLAPLLLLAMVVVAGAAAQPAPAPAAVAPAARSAPAHRPVLSFGSRGAWVSKAQSMLNRHGYRVPVTGFYGDLTARQVRRFQAAHGIRTTGKVGPLTWPKLLGQGGGQAAAGPAQTRAAAGSAGQV